MNTRRGDRSGYTLRTVGCFGKYLEPSKAAIAWPEQDAAEYTSGLAACTAAATDAPAAETVGGAEAEAEAI